MAHVFNLPRVGDAAVEADIQEWHVAVGDEVAKDQIVCEVETNKATIELPCPYAGFVLHLGGEVGDTIEVGDPLIVVGEKGESWSPGDDGATAQDEPRTEEMARKKEGDPAQRHTGGAKPRAMPAARKLARELGIELSSVKGTGRRGDITPDDVRAAAAGKSSSAAKPKATPSVRKLARELGVDLGAVAGSGRSGNITADDVKAAAAGGAESAVGVPAPVSAAPVSGPVHYAVTPEQIEGLTAAESHLLTGMRGAVATSMMQSLHGMAQLTHFGDWDADAFVKLREQLVAREEELGVRVSYAAILVSALAKAVREHLYMNASVVGNEIRVWNEVNVGVAVAAGDQAFLYVPVIRDADRKGFAEIAKELKALTEKVRDGKVSPKELSGSTITLSSLSTTGATWGTPIINPPNAALLNTQIIREAPVVRDGKLAVGKLMSFSLTYDHRIINGIGAEWFLATLRNYVESPLLLLT